MRRPAHHGATPPVGVKGGVSHPAHITIHLELLDQDEEFEEAVASYASR